MPTPNAPLWQGNNFKVIIKFSEVNNTLSDYIAYTCESEYNNVITSLYASFNDGNRVANPLGIMMSSTTYVSIYDYIDELNPLNDISSYNGYLIPGVPVEIYLEVEVDTYELYFTGNIINFTASYMDGGHQVVTINCEDKLNQIGATDISTLNFNDGEDHNGLVALQKVLNYCLGLESTDDPDDYYLIDENLIEELSSVDIDDIRLNKARDLINDLLSKVLGYITIRHDGIIYIGELIGQSAPTEEYIMSSNYCGAINTNTTSAIDYVKARLSYIDESGLNYVKLAEQPNVVFNNSDATFNNTIELDLPEEFKSIENINIGNISDFINYINYEVKNKKLYITPEFITGQTGIVTTSISVYGLIKGDKAHMTLERSIDNSTLSPSAETLEYNTNIVMTSDEATQLLTNIVNYIKGLRHQIKIDKTIFSPALDVGAIVELTDLNDTYNGLYRVSTINVNMTDSYIMSLTLLKID